MGEKAKQIAEWMTWRRKKSKRSTKKSRRYTRGVTKQQLQKGAKSHISAANGAKKE